MGGMQGAMATLANGLVECGVSVDMYAIFRLEHFYPLNPAIQFSESPHAPNEYNIISRIVSIVRNIRKAAIDSKAKTVVVYGKFYSALTLLATLGLKKRVFISDRASPLYRDFWYVEMLTSLIYTFIKPAGIIAQTYISAAYQRKRFGRKVRIEVIPNAIRPIKRYECLRQNVVLAVGRFGDPLKGFDRLIEAWGLVDAPDWILKFAGGSEAEEPSFGRRAHELGIYERIEFLGKVPDLDELYASSAIFVIPSRSEGFPNALAEAMTAGMCCVAFDFIAGPRDMIVSGENGIIVPEGNVQMLAESLQMLITTPAIRKKMAAGALKTSRRFERSIICKSILNFISTSENH